MNFKDQLEFVVHVDDAVRPEGESGYVSSAGGDSGSPYWVRKPKGGEMRNVLVAVHSWRHLAKTDGYADPLAAYIKDPYYQCRNAGSKITDGILKWIKEKW